MKIGIIGVGNIGGTLTRRFVALGHEVSVANSRGPETLHDLAAQTGASAVSVPDAAREAAASTRSRKAWSKAAGWNSSWGDQ